MHVLLQPHFCARQTDCGWRAPHPWDYPWCLTYKAAARRHRGQQRRTVRAALRQSSAALRPRRLRARQSQSDRQAPERQPQTLALQTKRARRYPWRYKPIRRAQDASQPGPLRCRREPRRRKAQNTDRCSCQSRQRGRPFSNPAQAAYSLFLRCVLPTAHM